MQKKSFNVWLRDIRGTTSISTFAAQVGVSPKTITRAEHDEGEVLLTTVVRICRGLGLSLTDFFQGWQGEGIEAAGQLSLEQWIGALTGDDVQRWLEHLLAGNQHNRELLIAALNLIVQHSSGGKSSPPRHMVPLFNQADIEKMTWDLSWFRYEVVPPLKSVPMIADLMSIYQAGGLVLPLELGAYFTFVREQKDLSLHDVSATVGISFGILSSMEKGMIRYVKLGDLIRLDEVLQRGGELLALYWWEISNRLSLEEQWQSVEVMAAYSPRVKHTLTSLLISVGRWLQVIYKEEQNTDWHKAIRYALSQPAQPPVPVVASTSQGAAA